jgi:hypothetical protein
MLIAPFGNNLSVNQYTMVTHDSSDHVTVKVRNREVFRGTREEKFEITPAKKGIFPALLNRNSFKKRQPGGIDRITTLICIKKVIE